MTTETAPGWEITEDKISEGEFPSRVGTADGAVLDTDTYEFRLYDDDGILYYVGRANPPAYWAGEDMEDGSLIKAWKWGEYDAGAIDLRIRLEVLHELDPKAAEILAGTWAERDGWISLFA